MALRAQREGRAKQMSGSPANPATQNSVVASPDSLLDVDGIGISFGGLKAVERFSIRLPRGGLCGLIGPNGAGKTTVFNLLTGVYQADQGDILLGDVRLNGKKPSAIA